MVNARIRNTNETRSLEIRLITYANYFVTYPIVLIFISYSFYLISSKHVNYQYIDEIFHIPQAQQYCNKNFSYWDPKITTPPGLYLLAYLYKSLVSIMPGQEHVQCDIATLRSLNTVGGALVFPLVVLTPLNRKYPTKFWISNIILLPLLTIYLSLFYTDVWSTVLILASFVCCYLHPFGFTASSIAGAFLAFASLWFRQTNIIWSALNLAMLIDQKIIQESGYSVANFENKYPLIAKLPFGSFLKSQFASLYEIMVHLLIFIETACLNILVILPFILNFIAFAMFLVVNKGITFGDKDNHVSTIHIPQLYYCLLFMAFYGWPLLLSTKSVKQYFVFSFGSFLKALVTLAIYGMMFVSIKKFTVVHPFLLADNRHYTFYLWRKVINVHSYSRYALIPAYHFIGVLILRKLANNSRGANQSQQYNGVIVLLAYVFCTSAILIPSPLFEPRYYLLPYLYWRLLVDISPNEKFAAFEPSNFVVFRRLVLEFLWNLFVNVGVLFIFIRFKFSWDGEPEVIQRIIW